MCHYGFSLAPPMGACSQPAPPRDNHEKSPDWEFISKAPKVMKTQPKATKKHEKWHWNQHNPDICDKLVFAHPLTPNPCFPSSTRPDSSQKIIKKEPGKKHGKNHLCCSKVPEKLSKWGPEIHIKSMRIRLWIPGCPFYCSYSLPGLPQCAKVGFQGAKMEPLSLPTDSFGH